MEKLVIDNFLAIEHAEIEIKKINLFIGPQAQGKSLISKLIYFFKEYPRTMIEALKRGAKTKAECKQFALGQFEEIFPKYTWANDTFNISYCCNRHFISITHCLTNSSENTASGFALTLDNDVDFNKAFEGLLDEIQKKDSFDAFTHFIVSGNAFLRFQGKLMELLQTYSLQPCLYVPAGRSFFAALEKNIFYFLHSDVKLDYLIVLFGKHYVVAKDAIQAKNIKTDINGQQLIRIEGLVKKIMGGNFLFENRQSWIVSDKGRVNIVDASSGQQEAFPIVLLLSELPYSPSLVDESIPRHFIIEEPEAHLFPTAQNDVVLLITNAYNCWRGYKHGINTFTIATHSPYILTAFNNLIQAGNVAASKNYEDLDELRAVVPESEWVDFNDVTAYVVNNGTVKSILNQELKLIDANMIDEVSDHLADKFRGLLGMEIIDE